MNPVSSGVTVYDTSQVSLIYNVFCQSIGATNHVLADRALFSCQ